MSLATKAPAPKPWPKLSEYESIWCSPALCLFCGKDHDVTVWIECDEDDQPTDVAIVSCTRCAKRHVDPHPRLYVAMERNRPFPGAMSCPVEWLDSAPSATPRAPRGSSPRSTAALPNAKRAAVKKRDVDTVRPARKTSASQRRTRVAKGNKIAGTIAPTGQPNPADMAKVIAEGRKVALVCEGVVFDAEYATFQVKGKHGTLVGVEAVIALPLETMLQACGIVMMQTLPGLVMEKRTGKSFQSAVQTQADGGDDGAGADAPDGKAG